MKFDRIKAVNMSACTLHNGITLSVRHEIRCLLKEKTMTDSIIQMHEDKALHCIVLQL